jgi:hypothetical protein
VSPKPSTHPKNPPKPATNITNITTLPPSSSRSAADGPAKSDLDRMKVDACGDGGDMYYDGMSDITAGESDDEEVHLPPVCPAHSPAPPSPRVQASCDMGTSAANKKCGPPPKAPAARPR